VILLDSQQILAAIGRSLETHVLPSLDDELARTQVHAAVTALAEVSHRLEHGDPYIEMNTRLETGLAGIATQTRGESPELAARIETALAAATGIDDPRERHRRLGEALTELLGCDDPGVGQVRQLLEQEVSRTAGEDSLWMSTAAIESLQ